MTDRCEPAHDEDWPDDEDPLCEDPSCEDPPFEDPSDGERLPAEHNAGERGASALAQQIADGVAPDWTSVSDPGPDLDAMRLIHDIAHGFSRAAAPPPAPPALFSWRHLQIRGEVGRGAFGRVYRAWDPVLKREVALKLVDTEVRGAEPGRSATFLRKAPGMVIAEARCLARLRHPNILAVHGAESEGGRVGIWSDLLRGRTLQALLEEKERLPAAAVIDLALPLAEALALIHRRSLVHGDVKPANIMIQDDASPVLMDFGAAREAGRPGAAALGSPRFMAPEQLSGEPPISAGDLFALGVVLYRCLTGRFPWPANSWDELEAAYAGRASPDLHPVPRAFRPLIGELLSAQATRRPSARRTAERLAHLRKAPQRLRRRAAIAVVVGSLVIGLSAALIAFRAERKTRLEVQALRDLTVSALQEADPERTSGPTSVAVIYDALAAKMETALADYPAALTDMRLIVGRGKLRLGENESAAAHFQRVLDETPEGLEVFARRRCIARLGVAESAAGTGDTGRAEASIRAVLDAAGECAEGLPPASQLTARNQLITVLDAQGRWREVLEEQLELLVDREGLHGEGSLPTAVDHHNLSNAYQRLGFFTKALEHGTRAAEILEANGAGRSLRLGYVKLAVAGFHNDLGAFDDAQHALDEARELYAKNLPSDSGVLLQVTSEQARLWRRSGESQKAETMLREHLSTTGPNAGAIVHKARRNLAYLLMDAGRWQEAHRLLSDLRSANAKRLSPLDSYFLAAETFAAARSGRAEAAAAARALDAALADLDRRSLRGIEPYRHLMQWRETLPP